MATFQANHSGFRVLRHPCLILGGIVGVCLATLAVAWVLIANRAPSLDRFAWERNVAAAAGVAVLLLVPVFAFLKSPARIFLSGVFGWTILSVTYGVMAGSFPRLAQRLGAFHLFTLGAVVIGLLAATVWVTQMLLQARQQTVILPRRRLP